MRNLSLSTHAQRECAALNTPHESHLAIGENGDVFVCSNLTLHRCCENADDLHPSYDYEASCVSAAVISCTYLSFPQEVCAVLNTGEIFSAVKDFSNVELKGTLTAGVLAAKFSYDEELLALVTSEFNLILMNTSYDIITEVSLLKQIFGEGEFINVGWGKKETQFHGSEGKGAAKKTIELDSEVSNEDKSHVSITWRGDTSLFAVGFVDDSNTVSFKVFNREGILQYTSEKQLGLENRFSWRPSGNVIATTQIYPNKYVIAFFEKNGLKHGEFTLPFLSADRKVEELSWSGDSEALAVRCNKTVLIYTTSNYHWYLKKVLSFDDQIKCICWDHLEGGKNLFLLTQAGCVHVYNWIWKVDHSISLTNGDRAVVCVIDGTKALLTDFKYNVTPPPMASVTLTSDKNINAIIFGPISNPNDICTVLEDNSLHFYNQSSTNSVLRYDSIGTLRLSAELSMRIWWKPNIIICSSESKVSVLELTFTDETKYSVINTIEFETDLIKFETSANDIIVQSSNGKMYHFDPLKTNVTEKPSAGKVFTKLGSFGLTTFGLTIRNKFYVDDCEIPGDFNSFFVHSDFLLLTNLEHNLLCTELSSEGIDGLKTYKNGVGGCVAQRKIERGARLVCAVAKDSRVILQMPRGNLEAVQPRPLSLKLIGSYLDSRSYLKAFDLMRKQRINLNLFYDHDPENFMKNIDAFIDDIKNNSWLSLFLSELDEEDVTRTMYASSYYNVRSVTNNRLGTGKITKICSSIRYALENCVDTHDKILPILTSYVKLNTVESLEKALLIVKQLKDNDSDTGIKADEALRYLQYLVHIDKLYNTALGLYDFNLVLFVASKSQKDPKEYIPFLNELNSLEENYKRFSIDKHLKRYESALRNLSKADREVEIMPFVRQHHLYTEALTIFKKDSSIYTTISNDYGHYLYLKRCYSEAGFIYKRCGNLAKAAESFKEGLEWEVAIDVALQAGWSTEVFTIFLWDLTTLLQENKKYSAALCIIEQYIKDYRKAIVYASEVGHFKSAVRLCRNDGFQVDLELTVRPIALKHLEESSDQIKQSQSQFIQHKDRLAAVRIEKAKLKLNSDNFDKDYRDDSDLFSDTSSVMASTATRSSSRTFRSSKNRRKHERKLVSLKEGSRFEDIALIRNLHTLVTSTFNLRADVSELCFALHYFEESEKAEKLQNALSETLNIMKLAFGEIWTDDLLKPLNSDEPDLDVDPLTTLEAHIRIPPMIDDIKWILSKH